MTWQPIETAPKDGTPILTFYPSRYGMQQYSIRYWGRGEWAETKEAWVDEWRQIRPNEEPTLWQPIVPP